MIISDTNSYYIVVKIDNQPNQLVLHPYKKYSLQAIDYHTLLYNEDEFIEELAKLKHVSKEAIKKDEIFIVRNYYVSTEAKWKMKLLNPIFKDSFPNDYLRDLYSSFLNAYNVYYNLSQFKSKYLTELGKQDYQNDLEKSKENYIAITRVLIDKLVDLLFRNHSLINRLGSDKKGKNDSVINNPKIGEYLYNYCTNIYSEHDAKKYIRNQLTKYDENNQKQGIPVLGEIQQFLITVLHPELKYRPDRLHDTYPEVMFGGKTLKQVTHDEINYRIKKNNGAQLNFFDDFGLDPNPNRGKEEQHDPHWVFEPVKISNKPPVNYEESSDTILLESIMDTYKRGEITLNDLRDEIYTFFDKDTLEYLPDPLKDKLRALGISIGDGFTL